MSVALNPHSTSNDDDSLVNVNDVVHTRHLCRDIKNLFHHNHHRRRQYDGTSYSVTPATIADTKRMLIAEVSRWIDCRSSQVCMKKQTILDSLVALLRALDDVDVENLQLLSSRCSGAVSKEKLVISQIKNQGPSRDDFAQKERRRRRLPKNISSMDVVQSMHNIGANMSDSDNDDDSHDAPKLYLSNSDRSKRAKKVHMEQQHNNICSMMRISMKDVMNARMPKNEYNDGSQMPISTLTHDAAVLRRDLYKLIAEYDVDEIKIIVESEGSSVKNDKLQLEMNHLTSTLLSRITEYPNSPSLRLSALVALDSIRELGLSDWGYKYFLDALLEIGDSWAIRFYAEIVSECHTYENPVRLLGISKLMEQALKTHEICTHTPTILRAVSHILVRRQNLLSRLDQVEQRSPLFKRENGVYKRLCDSMSLRFGSTSDWIQPSMSSEVRESVISALQAVGILSFFSCDDGISHKSTESSQSDDEYPFSNCFSLRSAHDRLGPCDGFNRLISHPESYEQTLVTPQYLRQPFFPSLEEDDDEEANSVGPFVGASEDVLIIVFSFLGFRSLTRATQCCTSWALAHNAAVPSLWSNLYLTKYKKSRFEEELALKTEASIVNPYLQKFLSIKSVADRRQVATSVDDYDWKHLFANKYATEKRSKGETCHIIGCCYVHRRSDHVKAHLRRHENSILIRIKKWHGYSALQLKTEQLKQEICNLEKHLQIFTSEPLPHFAEKGLKLDDPASVLRDLVFAYLDYKDVTKPVCKLWTRLARCNELWKSLYQNHFGTLLALPPADIHWKIRFRSTLFARNSVRGIKDNFGWSIRVCPVVDCHKELRSRVEFDVHLLRHVDQDLTKRIKQLRQDQKLDSKRKGKLS